MLFSFEEDMVECINVTENSPHQLICTAFDNEAGIGLLANYTGRNVFGKSSRLVVTGDISDEPSYKFSTKNNLERINLGGCEMSYSKLGHQQCFWS